MQSPRAKGPLYDPWALSKKLGAEFIGVFLFASVWSFKNQMLSSATAQAVPAGFVLGVTLALMVYNTGHISGGHLNPSVTLSLLFAGKMEIFHASCYILVQFLAAVLAAWTAHGVLGSKAAYPLPGNGYSNGTAFTVEMLYNTLLVMVVLHTACTKKTEGNTYYGVAIGFTVVAGSIVCAPISGGALNPAIGFMGCLANRWNLVGIYGPSGLCASLLGLILYRMSAPKEEVEQGVESSLCYMSCHWLPRCIGSNALVYNNELIGTFYLCLSVTLSVGLAGAGYLSASAAGLAIGATLMVVVYMGGYISGGHYNPAVTLAVMLCDRDEIGEPYWVTRSFFYLPRPSAKDGEPLGYLFFMIVQFTGAFLAAAFGHLILGSDAGYPAQGQYGHKEYSEFTCVVAEAIGTAALVFSVLNVAVSKDVLPNNYFGFVIGMTLFVSAATLGNISGGAFNPAVGLGLTGALGHSSGDSSHCWIYAAGPVLGSLVATIAYRCVEVRPLYVEDLYGDRVNYGTMAQRQTLVGEMEQGNPLFREEN